MGPPVVLAQAAGAGACSREWTARAALADAVWDERGQQHDVAARWRLEERNPSSDTAKRRPAAYATAARDIAAYGFDSREATCAIFPGSGCRYANGGARAQYSWF